MNNDTDIDFSTDSNSLISQISFYILLSLVIPSVLCSLLLFYYFLRLPELRQQHYSHQMIIYLVFSAFLLNAIDIPLLLPYLHNDHYIISMKYADTFCKFWIIYDYSTWSFNLWTMALLSLERYLLIFFKQVIMTTKVRRFCMYYLPISLIGFVLIFWYLYFVGFYPCLLTEFDYTQYLCGSPCYLIEASETFVNFDWVLAGLLPVSLTVLFTLMLILHILYQKNKISQHLIQQETWKRTRKMFLKLVPITLVFVIFTMPLIIVGLCAISDPWYSTTPYYYAFCFSYGLPLFIPFSVLVKQRAIHRHLRTLVTQRRLNRIAPMAFTVPTIRSVNLRIIQKINVKAIHTIHQ